MKSPFRLDKRMALITGGSSGIGEATARAFTRAGASVIILSIDKPRAEAIAAELPGASAIVCDVTDETAVNAAIRDIPKLDILVNSAGIGLVGSIEETSLDDLQRLFRVNVEGTFLVTKAALPLIKASHGSIINIGSVAGQIGVKRRLAYCARFSRELASAPAPSTRLLSKASSKSIIRTKKIRCARTCASASRSVDWAAPRRWPTSLFTSHQTSRGS